MKKIKCLYAVKKDGSNRFIIVKDKEAYLGYDSTRSEIGSIFSKFGKYTYGINQVSPNCTGSLDTDKLVVYYNFLLKINKLLD